MTVINTNSAALLARAYGKKVNQDMLKPMERLSSGLRINSASDDAAGLAVVNKMTAAIKDYDLSIRNSVDTISLLVAAESALSEINLMQRRLSELAVQSANGVYTQQDRDSMEMELSPGRTLQETPEHLESQERGIEDSGEQWVRTSD